MDSRYAAAYAALALAEYWAEDANPTSTGAGYDSALAAAEKAVALAPDEAAGYAARGFVRMGYRFDFAGAQSDLAKAVALNGGDADVLHRSAVLLATLGDLPAAIEREQKALALDPLSAEICMRLAFFYVAAGRFAEARPLYEKALTIAPNSIRALGNLGDLELFENRPEAALAIFARIRLKISGWRGKLGRNTLWVTLKRRNDCCRNTLPSTGTTTRTQLPGSTPGAVRPTKPSSG
jgi:Flp pilus assembly protein TadD